MAEKKIGILFSSGLDSTYLVWKNLKEGNQVYPFYFKINNNGGKSRLEINRSELLIKEFNSEFNNHVEYLKQTIELTVNNYSHTIHLQQVPIWILGLVYSQCEHLDEFHIGYIMNDDAVSYIDDIVKIYKSYTSIVNDLIPIKFPLLKRKKYEILDELPEKYKNLIVSCENPNVDDVEDINGILNYRPCGSCAACQRILNERPVRYLNGGYKDKLFQESLWKVREIGKERDCIKTHQEDNRYYVTIEIEDDTTKFKSLEPQQLEFNFDCVDLEKKAMLKTETN